VRLWQGEAVRQMARRKWRNLFVCQIRKEIIRFKTNLDLSYVKFSDGENKFVLKKDMKNNIVCPTRYRTRLAGGPLLRVATIRRTTDTFLFFSHTTNVPLYKFRCNIFIGVRIIKEMPGSVASGTHCIIIVNYQLGAQFLYFIWHVC
jgi:hypothetical protein